MKSRIWKSLALALALLFCLAGCQTVPAATQAPEPTAHLELVTSPPETLTPQPEPSPTPDPKGNDQAPEENGSYDSRDDVALYLHLYGELPDNYITKNEARDLGWEGGSVEEVAPGKCIGGDRFGNREGQLPRANGRTWHECDIDTLGEDNRGAKRIVYSNDGLIYYTDDHYESFELLYGEP